MRRQPAIAVLSHAESTAANWQLGELVASVGVVPVREVHATVTTATQTTEARIGGNRQARNCVNPYDS